MRRGWRESWKVVAVFNSVACRVLARLDRFRVEVEAEGYGRVLAHNTNTGRLPGLLEPGRRCLVYPTPRGRLPLRLAALEAPGGGYALVDTLLQSRAFEGAVGAGLLPWLRGCRVARRNPSVPAGRLDYELDCGGRGVLVELKSAVMLGPQGEAMYPDAPSLRGRRHVSWIMRAHSSGVPVMLVFVAGVPGARCFKAYHGADPELAGLIEAAVKAGVPVRAMAVGADEEGRVYLASPDLPLCPRPWASC